MNHGDNYDDFKDHEDEKERDDDDSEGENHKDDKDKLNDPTSNHDEINNIILNHKQDWQEMDELLKVNNFELYESMRFNLSNPEN